LYEWDVAIGQILTSTALNGEETTYRYDEWARLTEIKKPLDSQFTQRFTYYDYYTATLPLDQRKPYMVKMEQRTGPSTVSYGYTFYDGLGREVQTITPFYTGTQSALKWSVSLATYHGLGGVEYAYAPVQVTPFNDPVSGTPNTVPYFEPSHNMWGNKPVAQTEYDGFGQVSGTIATDGSITSYQYDIEKIVFPEWNNAEIPQLKQTITNANGIPTHYYNDSLGRLRAIDEVSGTQSYRTFYNYTIQDQLDVITDSLGHTTRIIYDFAGRKIEMRDPDMGTWYYVYDAAGNLIRQRDSRNHRTCLYYDWQYRLTGKQYRQDDNCPTDRPAFGTNVIHFDYDGVGQSNNPYADGLRTRMQDGSGSTQWWYDQRGRLTKEEKTIALDSSTSETFVTEYSYDSADRPQTLTYPDHPNGGGRETLTYSYSDPLQQWLRSVSTNHKGILASNLTYNSFGQLTDMDLHSSPMMHQSYTY
jgi:YD repeat-containing protein